MRINIIIILYIILMVGWRNEKRIKIDHLYAKLLQIIHLVKNALQIATIEIRHIHIFRITVPIRNLRHATSRILILAA